MHAPDRLPQTGPAPELGHEGPRFDIAVAQNGYAWWYVDALSEDGSRGLTIIAFVGSVFSPYYALSRARKRGDPENHVCINVALYGEPHRWAMTEHSRASLKRDARTFAVAASALTWDGTQLTIDIDETTVPLPSRLAGRVIVRPRALTTRRFTLDTHGRHRWQPLAPSSDVTVDFSEPAVRWRGTGYLDSNEGDEPLEAGFRHWTWSRFDLGADAGVHRARIFYDVVQRDGTERRLSLDIAGAKVSDAPALPYQNLATTAWRVPRASPCDAGETPVLLQTMENAPFYARSTVRSRIDGIDAIGVHETLSLDRVANPLVRCMLPFRMFRRR